MQQISQEAEGRGDTLFDAGCGEAWMTKKSVMIELYLGVALEPSQHGSIMAQRQLALYSRAIRCEQKVLNEFVSVDVFDFG